MHSCEGRGLERDQEGMGDFSPQYYFFPKGWQKGAFLEGYLVRGGASFDNLPCLVCSGHEHG